MNTDKLKKLEEICNKLEDSSVTLEQSIELFEEGNKIAKDLSQELIEAKGKITVLKQDADKFKEEILEL